VTWREMLGRLQSTNVRLLARSECERRPVIDPLQEPSTCVAVDAERLRIGDDRLRVVRVLLLAAMLTLLCPAGSSLAARPHGWGLAGSIALQPVVLSFGRMELKVLPVETGHRPTLPDGKLGIKVSQAIRAVFSVSHGRVPSGIHVFALYGLFTDPSMGRYNASGTFMLKSRNRPTWVVTERGAPGLPDDTQGGYTTVIDARTSHYIEAFNAFLEWLSGLAQ
jgi:hypothetical protein